ncbi:MAG: FtsB family cell division protein [Pseudomonadota bacterium]
MRRRLRHAAVPALCACAVVYFGYHAIQGDRGLITYFRYGQYIDTLKGEYDQTVRQREMLEHRVSLMRSQSLDPDLLEERARDVLGFAHPNDRVIYLDQLPEEAAEPE